MTWPDQPATPVQPEPVPTTSGGRTHLGPARRTIATALLAVGLLTVGGVAAVFAADPSASPAPTTTTQPSTGGAGSGVVPGTGGRTNGQAGHGLCPEDGTGGGSTAPDASAAPSTDGSSTDPSPEL